MCSLYKWKLNLRIFRCLDALWGPHTIDSFVASHKSVKKFQQSTLGSKLQWDRCPGTEGLEIHNNYTAPPFWLIPRILDLIDYQSGCTSNLDYPKWVRQRWFQCLGNMSVLPPIRLPNNPKTFIKLQGQTTTEPRKNPKWGIFAWRLNGNIN